MTILKEHRRTGWLLVALVSAILLTTILPAAARSANSIESAPAQGAGNCSVNWFFSTRTPSVCPAGPVVASEAAYLEFERGIMFWYGAERAVYVLYRDWQAPYWERFPDTWLEGMAEREPSIVGPLGLWQQPRRGFGLVWRNNPTVRARLGWALNEWEIPFVGYIQQGSTASGPVVFFTDDDGKVYQLGDQTGWDIFSWLG